MTMKNQNVSKTLKKTGPKVFRSSKVLAVKGAKTVHFAGSTPSLDDMLTELKAKGCSYVTVPILVTTPQYDTLHVSSTAL
jgi:hypothetical protein